MFNYHKRLFYPVHVKHQDPAFANTLKVHYAGADSELSSALRYINQRSNIANRYIYELLGIIAAEELGHMELVAVAIKKLGGPTLKLVDAQGVFRGIPHVEQSLDVIAMLQIDIKTETRVCNLYAKHAEMTKDPYMKKLIKFLMERGEVHKNLLKRAQHLIRENGSSEEFNELLYDYRMSLQVLK